MKSKSGGKMERLGGSEEMRKSGDGKKYGKVQTKEYKGKKGTE